MNLLLRCASLLCIVQVLQASLYSRPIAPPPFIQGRSVGIALAEEMKALASSGASSAEINREGRAILSKAYSANGRYFANNFPRGFQLDLSREDIRRVATNMLQGNLRNWHGYERELKFLNVISQDKSPFEILKVNNRARIASDQLVEFDALLRDKKTGALVSAEFKDKTIASRSQLQAAKEQIDKIARRASSEGVSKSIWVNRAKLSDNFRQELEDYATRRNVSVYTGITTGEKPAHNLKKPQRFDDVLEKESKNLTRARWAKHAGRAGVVITATYEVWKVGRSAYLWNNGGMTTRVAVVSMSEGAGGFAGALAGGYLGGQTGALGGPWAPVTIPAGMILGAVAGGVAGGSAGSVAGTVIVDEFIFQDLEDKETAEVIAYLQRQY